MAVLRRGRRDAVGPVLLVGPADGSAGGSAGRSADVRGGSRTSPESLADTLRAQFGVPVAVVAGHGDPGKPETEALFPGAIKLDPGPGANRAADHARIARRARRAGIARAICAPGTPDGLVRALARAGLAVTSMRDDESGELDERAFAALRRVTPGLERVSVVVPNYNYAHYLPARLASVFAQATPVFEIIVLDDGSSDDSLATLARIADDAGRRIRIVGSPVNGGSVFAQWRKASALARGEYLWIAEADDLAAPGFLGASLAAFEPRTVFSFCDSAQVGAGGERLGTSYRRYYARTAGALFRRDFTIDGLELVRLALCERNVVLNASAVLWRRSALFAALERGAAELGRYRLAGDWLLYLEALGLPGARVGYVAAALNVHRRHGSSVTGSYAAAEHLGEILAMQARARAMLAPDAVREAKVAGYVTELRAQFALETPLEAPLEAPSNVPLDVPFDRAA